MSWFKTRLIVEIAGFPQDHIDKALQLTAENFGREESKIKVLSKRIREAREVKFEKLEKTKVYSGFVEFEAEVKDLESLFGIIFDWMPSSIEVLEPEKIETDFHELNAILNDLTARLHQYDMVAKKLKAKVALLSKELKKKSSNN